MDPSMDPSMWAAVGLIASSFIGSAATVTIALLSNKRQANRIEAQFSPNGGSSMRDLLDHVALQVARQGERLDQHLANHAPPQVHVEVNK